MRAHCVLWYHSEWFIWAARGLTGRMFAVWPVLVALNTLARLVVVRSGWLSVWLEVLFPCERIQQLDLKAAVEAAQNTSWLYASAWDLDLQYVSSATQVSGTSFCCKLMRKRSTTLQQDILNAPPLMLDKPVEWRTGHWFVVPDITNIEILNVVHEKKNTTRHG